MFDCTYSVGESIGKPGPHNTYIKFLNRICRTSHGDEQTDNTIC